MPAFLPGAFWRYLSVTGFEFVQILIGFEGRARSNMKNVRLTGTPPRPGTPAPPDPAPPDPVPPAPRAVA
jgi:hypothetical protein